MRDKMLIYTKEDIINAESSEELNAIVNQIIFDAEETFITSKNETYYETGSRLKETHPEHSFLLKMADLKWLQLEG